MRYDLHIHSKYSYDSFISPERIIKVAKRKGLDGVAITDHNTIKGGIEAYQINEDKNFSVIIGVEIKTEYGDIIGLFLKDEIRSKKFEEVVEEIKLQGGIVVLAHPYRQYKFPERLIDKIDFIEGFNARSRMEDNKKAYELSIKFNKPMIAGSDAHFLFEIGKGITVTNGESNDNLIGNKTIIEGESMNYYLVHGMSFLIEKLKKIKRGEK